MAKIIVFLRNLTPELIGAEPAGAAADVGQAVLLNVADIISGITPASIQADPAGSARQAEQNAIQALNLAIGALSAQSIGADPAGAASRAKSEAILAAQQSIDALTAADVDAIPLNQKGAPGGVASLGTNGKVPSEQLPPVSSLADSLYPQHAGSLWYFGLVKSGVQLLQSNVSGAYYASDSFQNPCAVGNEIQFQFPLRAGTYTLEVLGSTKPDQGIQTVFLDGTSKGTMDWYSGGATNNVKRTITNFSVPTSGLQLLSFRVTGKHASSSNFYASRYFWKIY